VSARSWTLLATSLLWCSLALAEPTATDREAAKGHFAAAQQHYKVGRFEEALAEYTRAYERAPLPDILFNIGQCHRNLKNYDRAIFFFESYLRDTTDATQRPRVEKLIAELEKARQPPPPPQVVTTTVAAPTIAIVPVAPPPPKETPAVYQKWWFWTLVGGAALAAGATVFVVTRDNTPAGSLGTIDAR